MDLVKNSKIDFVGKRRIAFLISGILILIGIISMIARGGLNYGIDFTGGLVVQMHFVSEVKLDEIRNVMDGIGMGNSIIQTFGDENEFLIRVVGAPTENVESEAEKSRLIETTIREKFAAQGVTIRRIEMVGPQIGSELRTSALLAIAGASAGILLYIAFRFEFLYGVAVVVALLHDVLITVGFFSIFNKEINLTVVAALLTLVGYSLNDTIVVFDRIRENLRLTRKQKIEDVINLSVNQTLNRTLLTALTTLIVIVGLFFFGGEVIHVFSLALLIGIISGTYSTVYIAAPILIEWYNLKQRRKPALAIGPKETSSALQAPKQSGKRKAKKA